jgi:predicted transglutaminase-like cysteine proteinase
MPRNLRLGRGLQLCLLIVGIVSHWFGGWPATAVYSPDLSPAENVALRFPDLSTPPRSPPPSAAQIVALRFPGFSPSQIIALRFTDKFERGLSLTANATAAAAVAISAPLVRLINFQVSAALPPIGHTRFCLRYPDDCNIHTIDFRHRNIVLTPERWNELNLVNRAVNSGFFAEATPGDGVTEEWVISPPAGDCKDYAVTKRHELLARGWPSRALLLSEVVLPSGEHHLVLVVRVKDADLVLDNLNDDIRLVPMTYDKYLWVRIQSPQNPKFWMRVQKRYVVHTAMLAN